MYAVSAEGGMSFVGLSVFLSPVFPHSRRREFGEQRGGL
jgi:hypothetical protein